MKTLIIAEKPSVAKDIVKALTPSTGRFMEHDNHFENDTYLVSSAIGHLLEIFVDETIDPKRGRWNLKTLPVIPPTFQVRPVDKTKARLSAVTKLILRKDVTKLINACDAGREGELIFRLIIQHAGERKALNKPIERLWLQSMTPQAILEGFKNLRSDLQMKGLEDAARCRSESDWLVGINGTRAMTAFNSIGGGFFLTTVGRVQTPTLSILTEREEKILKHVPRDFYSLDVTFGAKAGDYKGRWFDPKWKKNSDPEDKADRFWLEKEMQIVVEDVAKIGSGIIESEESKTQSQASPLLFDLTALQREANSKFGLSAKTTLSIAQALYEKHKVLTYPRTDSKWLPEDYHATCLKTLESLKETLTEVSGGIGSILDNKSVFKVGRKVFDNTKISDHFAIIPTGKEPNGLEDLERKVFNLVFKRFVAAFLPPAEFNVVTRITKTGEHRFKSEGKVMTKSGWMAIYGKDASSSDTPLLTQVDLGETLKVRSTEAEQHTTKPAARLNESTLLGAMENVSKSMDDEHKEAMSGKGLGTPATRASIIEGLIAEKYINRNGKDLEPTPKAFMLMTLLKGLGIQELTSPELTGEWEYRLTQMEKGVISRETFMNDIATVVRSMVEKARATNPDSISMEHLQLEGMCPKCGPGTNVIGKYRSFVCSKACGFRFPRVFAGHLMTQEEAEELVKEKVVGPVKGMRNKMGREFSSKIILKLDAGLNNYVASFDFEKSDVAVAPPDLTGREVIAVCPCCKGSVYSLPTYYGCEKSINMGDNVPTCRFKVSKEILQQPIELDQFLKIVTDGETDFLEGFVSGKTNRKFKAKLVWDKKATRTSFVFEPKTFNKPNKPFKKK